MSAQDLTTTPCLKDTYGALAGAERQFRSVLLGQPRAAQLPIGAVRYDRRRTGWIRTAPNTWQTLSTKNPGAVRTDAHIDAEAEFAPRPGLLAVPKIRTSDVLLRLLQSFRAFQCQTRAICMATGASQGRDAPAVIAVQPSGCIEFHLPRFDGCRIEQPPLVPEGTPQETDISQATIGACVTARDTLVRHEMETMKLLVTYDASYRSLLQFAGAFDDFLTAFRGPLLLPLWQTLRTLQNFGNIPCSSAQCDE